MADELAIEGQEYIPSKKAAELSGYAQDYIGQLARSSQIAAKRIGGLWYISMTSLEAYKTNAESYKPEPPQYYQKQEIESVITFDGQDYVSASKAAEITGYNQDYVGQLARGGKIASKQIGNRWYVEKKAIQAHKAEKDALLAAVQAESVGIARREYVIPSTAHLTPGKKEDPLLMYSADSGDLLPKLKDSEDTIETINYSIPDASSEREETRELSIPIRVIPEELVRERSRQRHTNIRRKPKAIPGKTIFLGTFATAALTVVIVLSYNFKFINSNVTYTLSGRIPAGLSKSTFTASAAESMSALGDILEKILTSELVYRRAGTN